MNELLVKALISTGELNEGQKYDFDFDHQFIETGKYDAKPTYKKFTGYSPGVAVIGDHIVGIETATAIPMSVSANRIRLKGSLQGLKTTVSI